MEAYVEQTPMDQPFEWLHNNDWIYLSDYCNKQTYAEFDDMYDLIRGHQSLEEYHSRPYHTEESIDEVKEKYQKEFPMIMADVMKRIADDIINGNLKIQFDMEE